MGVPPRIYSRSHFMFVSLLEVIIYTHQKENLATLSQETEDTYQESTSIALDCNRRNGINFTYSVSPYTGVHCLRTPPALGWVVLACLDATRLVLHQGVQ